jgi:hypothetical protein
MRKAILPFSETGDDLKQRLQREHNGPNTTVVTTWLGCHDPR